MADNSSYPDATGPSDPRGREAGDVGEMVELVDIAKGRASSDIENMRAALRLAQLRYCGYCQSWHSKPCGEGCYWTPNNPTFEQMASSVSAAERLQRALATHGVRITDAIALAVAGELAKLEGDGG